MSTEFSGDDDDALEVDPSERTAGRSADDTQDDDGDPALEEPSE